MLYICTTAGPHAEEGSGTAPRSLSLQITLPSEGARLTRLLYTFASAKNEDPQVSDQLSNLIIIYLIVSVSSGAALLSRRCMHSYPDMPRRSVKSCHSLASPGPKFEPN